MAPYRRSLTLLGQIDVCVPDPNLAGKDRPRMLQSEEWTVHTLAQVDMDALDRDGELYRAVIRRVGTLGDLFDALLAITIPNDDRGR